MVLILILRESDTEGLTVTGRTDVRRPTRRRPKRRTRPNGSPLWDRTHAQQTCSPSRQAHERGPSAGKRYAGEQPRRRAQRRARQMRPHRMASGGGEPLRGQSAVSWARAPRQKVRGTMTAGAAAAQARRERRAADPMRERQRRDLHRARQHRTELSVRVRGTAGAEGRIRAGGRACKLVWSFRSLGRLRREDDQRARDSTTRPPWREREASSAHGDHRQVTLQLQEPV